MNEVSVPDHAITDARDLVAWLEEGCKPPDLWRIGTEHEKFLFGGDPLVRVGYEGKAGIRAILETLAQRGNWDFIKEEGKPVGLRSGQKNITLEPGGQIELSGAPVETLHQTCKEINDHLDKSRAVGEELNVRFIGVGGDPITHLDSVPFMPKGRYQIMRAYMPKRGSLGHEMMTNTCTVQVNLDFSDERDMVRKFRTALSLQPVAAAMFANSPFREGKNTGFLSWRNHIWSDTDPDRCGAPEFIFEDGMGFERYAQYALDVPMYFLLRDGKYLDVSGQSFRQFLGGHLKALPGEHPTLADWENHLTTIFTEVRLKHFLEMRSADAGQWQRLCALPALWTGVMYDPTALGEAESLVAGWSSEDRFGLFQDVPRLGFQAEIQGRKVLNLARDLLRIAQGGLTRRRKFDGSGSDESGFLDELWGIVDRGKSPAEEMLEAWGTRWHKLVEPILVESAH